MARPQRGLVLWLSVLAGLKSLASAGALAGLVGDRAASLFLAVSSAMDLGTATYVALSRPAQRRKPSPRQLVR